MTPYELILHNFMCYRDNLPPLRLDGMHVACLSGENGAGKSTLLDAITWALWGKARMGDDELIAQGATEMHVDLSFHLGGQCYRVIRKRQRGKTGPRGGVGAGKSWLDLQVRGEQGWRPISGGTIADTERQIEALLRMKYDTFINASFLLQGRADEFTRKTAAERKQVLADILDLREYTALEERAKARAKKLDDEIKGVEGLIEHLQKQAEQIDTYSQFVAQAEQRVAALSGSLERAEQEKAAADAAVQALQAQAERRKELAQLLEQLRREQRIQEQEIGDLQRTIGEAEALLGRKAEIEAGMAALAEARATQQHLEALRDRYDELEQQRQQHQLALKEVLAELRAALQQAQHQRDTLQQRAGQSAQLRATIDDLQRRIAALAPRAVEREQLEQSRAELEVRERRRHDGDLRREQLSGKIKLRQDSLVAVREARRETLARLDAQLADEARWQADLAAAREQRSLLEADERRLATLREHEQSEVDSAGARRAECRQLKEQAEQLKHNQALLSPGDSFCPVCRSELGHDGIERVRLHYDEELQAMRQRYAVCKKEADAVETQLKQTRSDRATLEQTLGRRQRDVARIESLETQLEQAARWRSERAQVQAELETVQEQLAAQDYEPEAQAELRALEVELQALGDARALAQERKTLQERIRKLDQDLREQGKLEGQLAACQVELAVLEADLAALPAAEAQLQTLSVTIEQGDYAHDIRAAGKAVLAAIEALGYSPDAYRQAREQAQTLAHWEAEERRFSQALLRLESDRRLLQQAEELQRRRTDEIEQRSRADALLEQELRALPTAQARAQHAAGAMADSRRNLDVAARDLAEKQAYLKTACAAAESLHVEQTRQRELTKRREVFRELADAFGKKGVQAMLIETAIPEIEREANRLLGRMTDNQMHLTFEMQRDTKKGDTVETLEIKIADALGTRIYDAFSGGEAMRVNFAIRIALSRLLARRAGANLETLVIDEGFGTLDATGRERFVEAITSVQQDFKRILVITHIEELKERFPAQIEITKTPQGSQWELR